jgi:23S rRNA pseudouridine2605 synthase
MRLQKFLSRAGVSSRRAGERLIREGRVRVDGQVVTELGTRVDPETSVVEVDGERVRLSPPRWIALHKPPGVLCSRGDPEGRRTIYDLLPEGPARELFYVGRLDYLSEGLVLLTNEGDVAHRLLHPSGGTRRRYEVVVAEPVPGDLARRLLEGVELEDGLAAADSATLLPGGQPGEGKRERRLLMTLTEGRNREVRRMLSVLGVTIHTLRRVAMGPIELGALRPGGWRDLEDDEMARLREAAASAGVEGARRSDETG